jgi:hypothetical protein
MKFLLYLPLVLSLCAAAPCLRAATASVVTSAPTEHVILQNAEGGESGVQVRNQGGGEDGDRWVGVSFEAPDKASLKKISFYISSVGGAAPGAEVTISLVKLEGLKDMPASPYKEAATEEAALPADIPTPDTLLTFELEKPWELEAGEFYGIVVRFKETANGRRINLTNTRPVKGVGQTFHTSDAGVTYKTTNPLKFILQTAG